MSFGQQCFAHIYYPPYLPKVQKTPGEGKNYLKTFRIRKSTINLGISGSKGWRELWEKQHRNHLLIKRNRQNRVFLLLTCTPAYRSDFFSLQSHKKKRKKIRSETKIPQISCLFHVAPCFFFSTRFQSPLKHHLQKADLQLAPEVIYVRETGERPAAMIHVQSTPSRLCEVQFASLIIKVSKLIKKKSFAIRKRALISQIPATATIDFDLHMLTDH